MATRIDRLITDLMDDLRPAVRFVLVGQGELLPPVVPGVYTLVIHDHQKTETQCQPSAPDKSAPKTNYSSPM